jgi:hypothetical protein
MRFLVAISCLVVFVSARPDVSEIIKKQGYAYKSPSSGSFFPSNKFGSAPATARPTPAPAPVQTRPPPPPIQNLPPPPPIQTPVRYQPEAPNVRPVVVPGEPVITKSYYVHAAPEDDEPEIINRQHVVRPRKHYNIVFVKAPSPKYSPGSNVNIFPENEEKTIVYVLLGKGEGPQVDGNGELVLPPQKPPSKPEVVFVRYNNEQEAQRAISDIQNSYNTQQGPQLSILGGENGEVPRSVGFSNVVGNEQNNGLGTPSAFRRNQ